MRRPWEYDIPDAVRVMSRESDLDEIEFNPEKRLAALLAIVASADDVVGELDKRGADVCGRLEKMTMITTYRKYIYLVQLATLGMVRLMELDRDIEKWKLDVDFNLDTKAPE